MEAQLAWWMVAPAAALGGALLGWWWRGRQEKARLRAWPTRWDLQARPLFNAQERALHRELRAALPDHLVLAKVSLVRFCQPGQAAQARLWYDRLMGLHVSLLVCHPNGAVVSAIDFEPAPGANQSKGQRLKEAVLEACRVRYLRCRPGQWPHASLLATWALGHSPEGRPAGTPPRQALHDAGDQLARRLRERRAERAARWAESGFAPDSFFAFDAHGEPVTTSPSPLSELSEEAALREPRRA
ncbi:DUF2726 domain-containing protein [Aquabacterium fontiphilum]|uniref:DUF2726 domain-containing protein n=1 Tax=Aquabacterium fontiphilum TaxID=450365 RepID=UPI001377942E|nr:DUF2726 domain-containing protein [Aquabacterium fontiphilum]NBD20575.1 DUF2726 domain-containing protein [Aquabacterium fontiphilum]